MVKDYLKKYQVVIFIFMMFAIGIYFNKIQKVEELSIKAEIDNNIYSSIAKVKRKAKYCIKYIYYYDKIKYEGTSDIGDESLIGRFFIVELSTKKPELSRLRIDKEVKDSIKIANSGFREKTLDQIFEIN